MTAAAGASTVELQRSSRQWLDDEWDAAVERLRRRGWVEDGTSLKPAGAAANSGSNSARTTSRVRRSPRSTSPRSTGLSHTPPRSAAPPSTPAG